MKNCHTENQTQSGHCHGNLVQIFRSHRRFNRFALAAYEDGFDVRCLRIEPRWFRPRITATFVQSHRPKCEEGLDCCQHCEC